MRFTRHIGIDYSAAQTAESGLKGLQVYPSLLRRRYPKEDRTPDEHDAYCVAAWLTEVDRRSAPDHYFNPPLSLPESWRSRHLRTLHCRPLRKSYGTPVHSQLPGQSHAIEQTVGEARLVSHIAHRHESACRCGDNGKTSGASGNDSRYSDRLGNAKPVPVEVTISLIS